MNNGINLKTAQDITTWCCDYLGGALDVRADSIDLTRELDELGIDSAVITSMLIEMEEWLGIDIPPSTFFSQSTLKALGDVLADRIAKEASNA